MSDEFCRLSNEQLSWIAGNSKDNHELHLAIVQMMTELEDLDKLPHSQARNRERKFLQYTLGRIKIRLQKLSKDQERRAKDKKLRRLETKAREDVALKSLIGKLVATGSQVHKENSISAREPVAIFIPKQAVIDTGDPSADGPMNSLAEKLKSGQSYEQIKEDLKKAPGFSVADLFVRDEDGSVEL